MERFHFPEHRHLYLVSHLLLRTTLSRYSDLLPKSWRFVTNDHGKPRLDPDLGSNSALFQPLSYQGTLGRGRDERRGDRRGCRAVGSSRECCRIEQAFFLAGGDRRAGKSATRPLRGPISFFLDIEGGLYQGAGPRPLPSPDSFSFCLTGERPSDRFSQKSPRNPESGDSL